MEFDCYDGCSRHTVELLVMLRCFFLWYFPLFVAFSITFALPKDTDISVHIVLTPAHYFGPRFCFRSGPDAMASPFRCCVRHCTTARSENCNVILHSFPNPIKEEGRFRSWLYSIGGDILVLDSQFVYKNRKVCHKHFESKYYTRSSRLSANAVPTLHLKGIPSRRPLSNVTNMTNYNITFYEPSTSTGHFNEPISTKTSEPQLASTDLAVPAKPSGVKVKNISRKQPVATMTKASNIRDLKRMIIKLQKKKDKYATRFKKALKLSENTTFQKCLQKFTTLAALFTTMQFREISKGKMGRRFTKDEKIMALSIYKQGPKAYRWLSKIFILPSPTTLSRLISCAGLKPGLNKKIFTQLVKRTQNMTENEKLCILLFDEISIMPHYDYNRKRDAITGFVNNGQQTKRNIADHALVFMIRGFMKNYKQPLVYTFCRGTTPKGDLKQLIKDVIIELQQCGLNVLATVCDQGTTNVSAINELVQETQANYLRKNQTLKHKIFEINGKEIIPLFDPPHLIKGIRNNLITKNMKCIIEGEVKVAKWEHLIKLHEENPSYKGIRLMKNLTEAHIDPKKIPKMKVKMATQVFSRTVATSMGYLADKKILPVECKDTADVLLFFDELFDSMNGSYDNSKKRSGKLLLRAVTPNSEHCKVWARAKKILNSMKFVSKEGREGSVPSVANWLRTLEGVELLKNKLFKDYKIKSFWMRHLNQDPLENFFGSIRSHGCRNISPTLSGFESAFTSLLINNLSSNHSLGSNCEQDNCKIFQSMDCLLKKDSNVFTEISDIDFDDINCEITDFSNKRRNPRIVSQLSYVTGYVLRKAKQKIFKNCKECKAILFNNNDETELSEYIRVREFSSFKSLTYPSENILKMFSAIQDVLTSILKKKSDLTRIKSYQKTILYTVVDFNFLTCPDHRKVLVEFIFEFCSRFFINNWCRDVNLLLNGTRTENTDNDVIKELAIEYYKRRHK